MKKDLIKNFETMVKNDILHENWNDESIKS